MMPPKTAIPHLYLKQGEMTILEYPAVVSTILGSCVAVTLFNRRLGMSAISHALLPSCKRQTYIDTVEDLLTEDCVHCREAFKYVDCSAAMMAEAFTRLGIQASEIEAQLYGGSKMFGEEPRYSKIPSVGAHNVAVAKKVIADSGLNLSVCDVGGTVGRKLFFDTRTGKVTVHKMGRHTEWNFTAFKLLNKDATNVHKEKNPCARR